MKGLGWGEIFHYNENSPSGLIWAISIYSGKCCNIPLVVKGNDAGSLCLDGYYSVMYKGKSYKTHRIVFEIFNGVIPNNMFIDHIDGIRGNNNIENLRLVSKKTNQRNVKLSSRNSSGKCGVCLNTCVSGSGKIYSYWQVQWYDLDGCRRTKYFNINKYGKDQAFKMACDYRQEMIKLLNENGAGYSERHGL